VRLAEGSNAGNGSSDGGENRADDGLISFERP
jgi:hypothetical protein